MMKSLKKFNSHLSMSHLLVVCYQGGIHSMNQIVKTPFLQINSIPLNINGLIKPTDKIISKKFFSTVEKNT